MLPETSLTDTERRTLQATIDAATWTGPNWVVKEDGKLYIPNPGQQLFHDSKARYRAFIGGRGSGKTTAGAQEAIKKIKAGQSGAVYNPDFENFKDSTWPEFKKWIPWHHVLKRDQYMGEYGWEPTKPFTLHFDTGATVKCKGIKDPESARGPNINWLWYDEAGRDRHDTAWLIAIASVRIGPDPTAFVTTTPKGVRHWIYEYFHKQKVPDEVKKLLKELGYTGKLYDWFSGSIQSNQHNLDPIFLATMLASYTGKYAEQELGGKFVEIAEGIVYEEFSLDEWPEGNITDDEPDPNLPIELAVDDGWTDPRAILFIQRQGANWLVFDEMYHTHHLEETCVQEVVERCEAWPWEADDEARALIVKEGADGRHRLLPEIACVSHDAPQLRKRFKMADIPARFHLHKIVDGIAKVRPLIKDGHGRRSLKVHRRCANLIGEVTQGYRYPDKESAKNRENPEDANNHAADALRQYVEMRT